MARPAGPFAAVAGALFIVGVILLIVAQGWAWALGIVLVALSLPVAAVAGGLLSAAGVARWASRRKPFA